MTGTSTGATGDRDVGSAAESPTRTCFVKTPREPSGERVSTPVSSSDLPPLPGNFERRVLRRKKGGTTPGRDSACRPLWRQALCASRTDTVAVRGTSGTFTIAFVGETTEEGYPHGQPGISAR
jgi:hypothetical protein